MRSLAERLENFIEPEPNSGCWLWVGYVNPWGYGYVSYGGHGKAVRAHRLIFELERGPIPKGLQLDHLCRVRHCVNPWHLEPVTQRENLLRGEGVSAQAARKTRCPQGHPYSGENLYFDDGARKCRTCVRARLRARYHRRKVSA